MNGRHIDKEAAWQGDVAGDAGALFAQGLLGDLDDDILTGLEHFRNELRSARGAGTSTLIAAILPGTTGSAGTAFEASAWTSASRTARASTAITAATIVASTVASTTAAAEGSLKAGTRATAADARRIAWRKILARSAGTARRTSFTGKQDDVVFDDGWLRSMFA